MYLNRIKSSALAMAGAAVMLTACAGGTDSPTSPKAGGVMLTLGTPLDGVTTGVVQTEIFKVCKTYTGGGPMPAVTINVRAVDNDNAANIGLTSVTLTGGQCKEVWIAGGSGATVTATEVVPANYTTGWEKWDDLGDNLEAATRDASGAGNVASGVVTGSVPSGGAGTTVRFTNTYAPPPPPPPGTQGCTPGYWKQSQHFGSWVGYTRNQSYEAVFGVSVPGTPTLLQALGANGGGINALMRHSTAALLNSANNAVNYGATPAQVIAATQAAIASGNYETQKNIFAGWNERGCPLGRDEG